MPIIERPEELMLRPRAPNAKFNFFLLSGVLLGGFLGVLVFFWAVSNSDQTLNYWEQRFCVVLGLVLIVLAGIMVHEIFFVPYVITFTPARIIFSHFKTNQIIKVIDISTITQIYVEKRGASFIPPNTGTPEIIPWTKRYR